ncbi:MAG: VCBS repeat-containing protein [Bryobacterales bacterium]|nr:VCBS repeat-containing protein [Bryobacterales bacterium]
MPLLIVLMLLVTASVGAGELPSFRQTNIVTGLKMGYQVVLADLNADGKPDVVVVDERSDELAWYENPSWQRHIIATEVPRVINLECQDLNGDGIPEIAMAHYFESNPDRSAGDVLLLEHDGDPRKPWRKRPIDRVATAHRIRWIPVEAGKPSWLLVAPIVGEKVYAPEFEGKVPIYAYRPGEWKRMRISGSLNGVLHSIHPVEWEPGQWHLLTASFDGLQRLVPRPEGEWTHIPLHPGYAEPCPRCGTSEVKEGYLGKQRFLATIEPWHGNIVAVYLEGRQGWKRVVIEEGMVNGHALAVADLDGDGRAEIVGSFRGQDFRLSVYQAADADGATWNRTILNEGKLAGADCKIADITGNGRPDIVCSGASTGNVMLLENLGKP